MPKNSLALLRRFALLIIAGAFFCAGNFLPAEELLTADESSIPQSSGEILWYRSNSSGLALERLPSRLAALRNEYSLSIERFNNMEILSVLPGILLPYYEYLFSVELRIIYENGKEYRRQWIFRDNKGYARLTASGNNGFFNRGEESPDGTLEETRSHEEQLNDLPDDPVNVPVNDNADDSVDDSVNDPAVSGFIEIRDSDGRITKELSFDGDLSEWEYRYLYNGNFLLKSETLYGETSGSPLPVNNDEEAPDDSRQMALVYTDNYRYSRSGSLRAIDRLIHEGAGDKIRIGFPRIGPGLSSGMDLMDPGIVYVSEFLSDINISGGVKVNYTFDSRGRILTEVWKDADDEYLGEYRNVWAGDKLESVLWKSLDDERLVEYEYDSGGNRIVERNFRHGVLERSVISRNGKETEEIYMGGRLVLRAYWENGIKISEERVTRPGREMQR